MIVGVNIRLMDGRTIVVVPGHVVCVVEVPASASSLDAFIVPAHGRLTLTTGEDFECAPMDCPPEMPQSVAVLNAINGAIGRVLERLERREALAGAPVGLPGR